MIFRVRFKVAGGHVHCALFSAKQPNMTYAKCGDFVVTVGDEFIDLMRALGGVEFLGDDKAQWPFAEARGQLDQMLRVQRERER